MADLMLPSISGVICFLVIISYTPRHREAPGAIRYRLQHESVIHTYTYVLHISHTVYHISPSIYVPVPSFASAGVPPPQWYGLTMEGRAHTQCYVGNSFMS